VPGAAANGLGTTGTGATAEIGTTPIDIPPSELAWNWSTKLRSEESLSAASTTPAEPVAIPGKAKFPRASVTADGSPASRIPSWFRSTKTNRPARPASPGSSTPLAFTSRKTVP